MSARRLLRNGSPSLYIRSTLIGLSKAARSSTNFWKTSYFIAPWKRPESAIMSRWQVGQNVHWKLQALAGSAKTTNGVDIGMTGSSAVRPVWVTRGSSRAFLGAFPSESVADSFRTMVIGDL